MKVQALLGVPYSDDMIADAEADVRTQAASDAPDGTAFLKRYPKAQARDFDGDPTHVTEADALIAYLQMLGTLVDFKPMTTKQKSAEEITCRRHTNSFRTSHRPGGSFISSGSSWSVLIYAMWPSNKAPVRQFARMPLRED